MEGRKRLVQGVAGRLCAWESELAQEAKTSAHCLSCGGNHLSCGGAAVAAQLWLQPKA
jgi:hypothetical protein